MPRRVFLGVLAALVALAVLVPANSAVTIAAAPAETTPPSTIPTGIDNPFIPEQQSIGECISAVPKPGCGSEERGGWHQYLVAVAMVGGLAVVGWRVVAGIRKSQAARAPG